MNRRDAIKAASLLVGGALITSSGILAACARDSRSAGTERLLDANDQALMEEIADTLLPTTPSSPGARAAGVGPTINLIVSDCYDAASQQRLVRGLRTFRDTCQARHGASFASLTRADREALLRDIDAEARRPTTPRISPSQTEEAPAGSRAPVDSTKPVPAPPEPHYFPLVRELAEGAYFSSEIGMTQALRYIRVPGRWIGCVPLKPGQPAWA